MSLREWGIGFALALSGCAAPSRQVQATVADAVGRAANEAAPIVVDGYRRALFACLDKSMNRPDYMLCRGRVDGAWGRVRLSWGHLRMAQADYATALERGDADVMTYVQWLRIAYCEFRADVPKEALGKVPELPGLACEEFDGKEPRPGIVDSGARTVDGGAQ